MKPETLAELSARFESLKKEVREWTEAVPDVKDEYKERVEKLVKESKDCIEDVSRVQADYVDKFMDVEDKSLQSKQLMDKYTREFKRALDRTEETLDKLEIIEGPIFPSSCVNENFANPIMNFFYDYSYYLSAITFTAFLLMSICIFILVRMRSNTFGNKFYKK